MPVWSPQDDAVAWGSEDGLSVWRRGEQTAHLVSTEAVAGRPAWSPDGRALAFVSEERAELAAVDATTGESLVRVQIASDPAHIGRPVLVTLGGPAWSPNGERIAFVCRDSVGDELCVVNADGSDRRQVTRLEPPAESAEDPTADQRAASNAGPPAWSPDGARIAVAAYPERRKAPGGVFIVDLAAGRARRVSPLLPNSEIEWYPEGDRLLFSTSRKGRSDAVQVTVEDESSVTLTEDLPGGGRAPTVDPASEQVGVESGGKIVVLGGGDPTRSLEAPAGLKAENPAWDANGEALSFQATENPLNSYD